MVNYLLMALFIVLSAFFSGSEMGVYCVNRVRLRWRQEHGWPGADRLRRLISRPRVAINTILVGNNIANYLATVLCATQLAAIGLAGGADLYSSLIMPPVLLVFAEIMPKSLYQRRADTLMYRTAPLLLCAKVLFYPVLVLLQGVWKAVRTLLGVGRGHPEEQFTDEKFRFYLSEGAALGVLSDYQRAMAENILRVKSLGLEAALVPLQEVVMLPRGASYGEVKDVLGRHRFSRIPVYEGSRENVVGLVNVLDVLSAEGRPDASRLSRRIIRLDRDVSVGEALFALQKARQQMAVVTGEGGEASGIVTVKDLVEEIVGELRAW